MANKKMSKFVYVLIFVLFMSVFGAGCAKKGSEEPAYSKAVAEDFIIAVSKSDYDAVSDLLSEDFKESLRTMKKPGEDTEYASEKDAFIEKICKPLTEKIGEYEKESLVFIKTLTEKGYTSVFYNTKFSKETQGPVTVQLVFEEAEGKMLVAGLWLSSKILKQ